MARVLVKIRILPESTDVNLDDLMDKIASMIPEGFKVHFKEKEPMAFGMDCLIIGISMPDEEGYMDKLEDYLRNTEGVQEINVVSMTRIT